jgi:hypothetical protein
MRDDRTTETQTTDSDDYPGFANYLPATPRLSASPGPVEWFLTRLFRQGERRAAQRAE